MHLASVHREAGTLDGDAGAEIHHLTRELDTADDGEVIAVEVVGLGVEGDGQAVLAVLRQHISGDA